MGNNVLGANRLGERLSNPGANYSGDTGYMGGGNPSVPPMPISNPGETGLISGIIGAGIPGDVSGAMPPKPMPMPPMGLGGGGDISGVADRFRGAMSNPTTSRPFQPRPMVNPMGMPGGNMGEDMTNPVQKEGISRKKAPIQTQDPNRRRMSMF